MEKAVGRKQDAEASPSAQQPHRANGTHRCAASSGGGAEGREVVFPADQRERLAPRNPDHVRADAEFALGEYLYKTGHGPEAIGRITCPIGQPGITGKDPAVIAVAVAAALLAALGNRAAVEATAQ